MLKLFRYVPLLSPCKFETCVFFNISSTCNSCTCDVMLSDVVVSLCPLPVSCYYFPLAPVTSHRVIVVPTCVSGSLPQPHANFFPHPPQSYLGNWGDPCGVSPLHQGRCHPVLPPVHVSACADAGRAGCAPRPHPRPPQARHVTPRRPTSQPIPPAAAGHLLPYCGIMRHRTALLFCCFAICGYRWCFIKALVT